MKIVIEQDTTTKKINTQVTDVPEGMSVDMLVVVQWLSLALVGAINKTIEVRNHEQGEKKIYVPKGPVNLPDIKRRDN